MTTRIPIRTVYDAQNDPVGLAEFQVGDYLGIDYGGTGGNTVATARVALSVDDSNIRKLISVTGGGSYNNTTGVINISATDLTPYAKTVDLTTANVTELTNLYFTNARVYANVVNAGFYDTVSNTAPIGATENGTTLSITHLNSGVAASTYGGSSKVPVLTVNATGHITSAANVDVAGVTNFSASGNTFTISTADGGSFSASIPSGVDLVSPDLLGTPLAPTAAAGTNTTQVATTAFVRTEISNLVDAAPAALDTLNELAAALGDDANFATTTATSIGNARAQANTAYDRANVGVTVATSAFDKANTLVATVAGVSSTSISNSQLLSGILSVDGASSNLDADLLDGQQGSYYLDWTNVTNKPDPVITLGGDLSGSVTLTDLASGTLTATIVANSVELGTDTTGNYVATVAAGTGISTTGASSGEGIAHSISLATSGVSAASYGGANGNMPIIAVDTYGRITSAANTSVINAVSNTAPIGATTSSGTTTILHLNSGAAAATYGSAAIVPVYTVNATGHITSASNVTISIPSSALNTDVALGSQTSGNYVATIAAGTGISTTGASSGEGIAHSISLATSGVSAATYGGGGSQIPTLVVDTYGRVTSAANVATTSITSLGTITTGTWNGSSISTTYTDAKVTSVNGLTGAVTVSGLNRTIQQISTSTSASAGNTYAYSANVTITLPASPSAGDTVGIINLTTLTTAVVNRNTKPIMGLAEDFIIDTANAAFELVYTDATYGWRLV